MPNPTLLSELKNTLTKAAFLVVSKGEPQETHALLVEALVIVSRLEDREHELSPPLAAIKATASSVDVVASGCEDLSLAEVNEVKKVRSRLRLWSRRPQQINARILTAFLNLRRSGMTQITEQSLRSELPSDVPFDGNYAQMKIIADRNCEPPRLSRRPVGLS